MDEIEQIKAKINIVDLISEYLPLKKAGVNFKANCPFHSEKTPSFMVSPERGTFHCFGCSKNGDIFTFLMEKEGLEFKEALEILAKKAGMTLKRRKNEGSNQRERLIEANLKAAQFFHYLLTEHRLGKKALEYLRSRGLTDATIKEFNLGYAPNSWDSLTDFLKKRGFSTTEMIDSGLGVASRSGCYDRFRGRVIFPLVDVKGTIRGFAGRVLTGGEPKYLNSPQTLIFDKSEFLFGLNLAKAEIKAKNAAILTEGEMDMLLSYQSGVKNVVAVKGTALTGSQIELIKRYTDTILLCFDADLAGDWAARRGIELADAAGLNIKIIEILGGKDPAEMAIKNLKAWVKAVEEAEPIYDYYLKSVQSRFKVELAVDKKQIASELMPIWKKISDPLIFEHYLQKLAALLGIPEGVLRAEISKQPVGGVIARPQPVSVVNNAELTQPTRREMLEEYLVALLLKIPSDLTFVPSFPETLFTTEQFKSVYVLLVLYLDAISFQAKSFMISDFVKTLPNELIPMVDRLYLLQIDDKLGNSRSWEIEVRVVVTELKKALVKASLEKLSLQIKSAQSFGKIEILETLNKRFRDLSVKLRNL